MEEELLTERQQWFLKRKQVITATDIGAIAGLSPYRSAFDVWLEKTREDLPPEKTSEPMSWGNRLEAVIAQAYSEQYKIEVKKAQFVRRDIDGVPCGCTPDYTSIDDMINIEVKTARSGYGWGDAGTDIVPEYYITQTQWQMGICNQDITHLACLIGASDFRIYNITFNQELFDALVEAAKDFWQLVITKTPPEVDGSESCRHYYSNLNKNGVKGTIKEPSQTLINNVENFFHIKKTLSELEEKKEIVHNTILKEIGEYSGVKLDGIGKLQITRSNGRESISWKGVADILSLNVPAELVESAIKASTKKGEPFATIRVFPEKE